MLLARIGAPGDLKIGGEGLGLSQRLVGSVAPGEEVGRNCYGAASHASGRLDHRSKLGIEALLVESQWSQALENDRLAISSIAIEHDLKVELINPVRAPALRDGFTAPGQD